MNDQNQSVASKATKKKNEPELIPRPASAFRLCTGIRKQEIFLENPEMKYIEVIKRLGREWRQLSENEKRPFFEEERRRKKIYMQFYSNEYPLYEKFKLAVDPKELAILSCLNLCHGYHELIKDAIIGEHDSDNHPEMASSSLNFQLLSNFTRGYPPLSNASATRINFQFNPEALPSFTGTFASQSVSHAAGGYQPLSDAGEMTTNFQLNPLATSSHTDPYASQFYSHAAGGYPPSSNAGSSTINFQPNPGVLTSFTDTFASQFVSHATGGYPPLSDVGESMINFQSNPLATSHTYASQNHFLATGGYTSSSDVGELTNNIQLNPVAASAIIESSTQRLNPSCKYHPQPDDHNVLNQNMLKCCESFRNYNPNESQQNQQLENFSFPSDPSQVVTSTLHY